MNNIELLDEKTEKAILAIREWYDAAQDVPDFNIEETSIEKERDNKIQELIKNHEGILVIFKNSKKDATLCFYNSKMDLEKTANLMMNVQTLILRNLRNIKECINRRGGIESDG